MPNFSELTDQVISHLHAETSTGPRLLTLQADMTTVAATVMLSGDIATARGIIEIDDELIYIDGADPSTFAGTIPLWGRGYQGSPVTEHLLGSRVTVGPRFPRHIVKRRINDSIRAVYPHLFAVGVDLTQTSTLGVESYPLPIEADQLISVMWYDDNYTNEWIDTRHYRVDMGINDDDPAGRTITFLRGVPGGVALKFVYRRRPEILVNNTDDFRDITGLPEGADELVALRTTALMITGPELAGKQVTHVEQSDRAAYVQAGASTAASRYMYGLYEQRLQAARDALLDRYRIRGRRGY